MARTAKRKRKPKRAPAKRGGLADLLDIAPAKPPTPAELRRRKRALEEWARRQLAKKKPSVPDSDVSAPWFGPPLLPLSLKLHGDVEEPPRSPPDKNKRRLQPQQEQCRRIFPRLFSGGPIPDEVELSTTSLRQHIAVELEREAKQAGKKPPPTPSWDTVRAARRNPKSS